MPVTWMYKETYLDNKVHKPNFIKGAADDDVWGVT